MSFQDSKFVRNQNFVRDRDLGAPTWTIDADKVDDEFDNVANGLTTVMTAVDAFGDRINAGINASYSKAQADGRFVHLANGLDELNALSKDGGTTGGPITLAGKPGAAKGTVTGGTATFDYADGNVQSIVVNGAVTFAFASLPAIGGSIQVNLAIQSGSITIPGTTWWEQGGGEKSTNFSDLGLNLKTGRPYRLIVEMVAGFRTGIMQ